MESGSSSSWTPAAASVTYQRDPRVILFLHCLAIDVDDDFPGTVPLRPNRMDQLTAAYILPLDSIFSSPLNFEGKVQTVYVHFGRRGIFEMNPRAAVFMDLTPQRFENALMELFQNNQLVDFGTNEVVAHRIQDINAILPALPNNCRKVGCLSGSTSLHSSTLREFVDDVSQDENLLFVIGKFHNSEIEEHLEEFVKVSNFDLEAATCLMRIMEAVAQKWNVH